MLSPQVYEVMKIMCKEIVVAYFIVSQHYPAISKEKDK
jgi:hypothetical protein